MNAKVDIGWDGIINIKLKGERELKQYIGHVNLIFMEL
jgi:hypothetical protein